MSDPQKLPINKNEFTNHVSAYCKNTTQNFTFFYPLLNIIYIYKHLQNNTSPQFNAAPIEIINFETNNSFNKELGFNIFNGYQPTGENCNSKSIHTSTEMVKLQEKDQQSQKSITCSEKTSKSINKQLLLKKNNEQKKNSKKIISTTDTEVLIFLILVEFSINNFLKLMN